MRISEYHAQVKGQHPKPGAGKPRGIRAAWKRTNRGRNDGRVTQPRRTHRPLSLVPQRFQRIEDHARCGLMANGGWFL